MGLAVSAQDIEYGARGDAFAWFGAAAYACCVRRTYLQRDNDAHADEGDPDALADDADTGTVQVEQRRGRRRNFRSAYCDSYELRESYTQSLASLLTVPIFGGLQSVPRWPNIDDPITDATDDSLHASMARFAEWVFAVILPHPAGAHQYLDTADDVVIRLGNVMNRLRSGTWRLQINESVDGRPAVAYYDPPPGFSEAAAIKNITDSGAINPDFQAQNFTQQSTAQLIASLARSFTRPSINSRRCQRMWRARSAQRWACFDAERALFPEEYANNLVGGDHNEDDEPPEEIAEFESEVLRAMHNVDVHGDAFGGANDEVQAYLRRMSEAYGVILEQSAAPSPIGTGTVYPAVGAFHLSLNDIKRVAEALAVDPAQLDVNSNVVPDDAPVAIAGAPRRAAMQELENLIARPSNAPNQGQTAFLRVMTEYFDEVDNGNEVAAPLIFLDGAGGTGKSFAFSCLEIIARSIRRNIAPTALTGVA